MQIRFKDKKLERFWETGLHDGTHPDSVLKRVLALIAMLHNAPDIRRLYAFKGLHFEKLAGDRKGQHSLRLNRRLRLVVEICAVPRPTTIYIIGIEDYH